MHCGKKWWIREFVDPYIFPLNPDYVATRSLRSLRSNKVSFSPNTVEEETVNSATIVTTSTSHEAIEDAQVVEEAEVEEEEEYDTDSDAEYPCNQMFYI